MVFISVVEDFKTPKGEELVYLIYCLGTLAEMTRKAAGGYYVGVRFHFIFHPLHNAVNKAGVSIIDPSLHGMHRVLPHDVPWLKKFNAGQLRGPLKKRIQRNGYPRGDCTPRIFSFRRDVIKGGCR